MNDEYRYLVLRDDRPAVIPFAADDPVITYELGEPWPYADLPPHEGHSLELVAYQASVLHLANGEDDWRVESNLRCDCKQQRVVAQVLVHVPSAQRWVTAKPERVPSAYRKPDAGVVQGWALHGVEGEQPHVGTVSSCKGCDKRWLVLSFFDRAELLRIASARHGAHVAP